MKILIESYNTCTQNKSGGVQVRINKIADLLIKRNITVDFFNKFSTKVVDYDILHVFMLNNEDYALIKYAKSHGVKVVISTIVPLINGWKIDMYRRCGNLPVPTTYKMLMQSLQLADLLIVETQAEKDFIVKHYKIQKSKICIIPNGIDKYEGVYRDIYNYIDEGKKYILQVGRFDKNKNQLNVIKAMKNENIDLFIDDQLNNCLDVLKQGIKVIRISNEICNNKNIVDLNNWTKIYEYIGELDETK